MVESLGRLIQRFVNFGCMSGLAPSSANLVCSHQQFVEDSLLLGQASIKESKAIKWILHLYEAVSRKRVILQKSVILFFNTMIQR